MGRSPCCSKEGLNRGAWTVVEDQILIDYITTHGDGGWRNLPKKAGLKRCGKSCRLRWLNYLRPDIKRGNISSDEEELIVRLHKLLGNRWSLIAGRLPGRTDNEIKNYWNTNLRKKVQDHHPTSISTSWNRKWPKQSIEKKASMTKPSLQPPTVSSSKVESINVIRTKASRCTKVFITEELKKVEYLNSHAVPGPSMIRHSEGDLAVPGEDNNSSATATGCNMADPSSIGEQYFLSDLLDFSELCNFDNAELEVQGKTDHNSNNLSPPCDQPLLFPEEMLDGWTGIDGVEVDFPLDLQFLAASFLDSEEDWLGKKSESELI